MKKLVATFFLLIASSILNAQDLEQTMVEAMCPCFENNSLFWTTRETPCLDEVIKANYKLLIKKYELISLTDSANALVSMYTPMVLIDMAVPLIENCDPFYNSILKEREEYWQKLEADNTEERRKSLETRLSYKESPDLLLDLGYWHLVNGNVQKAKAFASRCIELKQAHTLDKALLLQGAIEEWQKEYQVAANYYQEAFKEDEIMRYRMLSATMRRMAKTK